MNPQHSSTFFRPDCRNKLEVGETLDFFFKRLSADGCRQSTCTISAIDQSIVIDVLNTPDHNNILQIWEERLELFLDHQ